MRVDDEALAVDDIGTVGSFGDFLSMDATLAHMREQSQPQLIDRRVREDWEERGSTDMYQRAETRARESWIRMSRSLCRTTCGVASVRSSTTPTGPQAPERPARRRPPAAPSGRRAYLTRWKPSDRSSSSWRARPPLTSTA